MPEAHYGLPKRVADGTVEYGDGVSRSLSSLQRQDLMRVAGAIAKSKGEKTGGTSWDNDRLRSYIAASQPWEAGDAPQPQPKDGEDRIPTEVLCACGHTYTYRLKVSRQAAQKKWLEGKPCPKCSHGKDAPKDAPKAPETPQEVPEATPEAPKGSLPGDIDLDALIDAVASKVLQKLKPPAPMPDMHHEALPEVVSALQAGANVWLQGPPGTAKSTIAEQAAKALGLPFYAVSCHEYMTPTELFGYMDANGVEHSTGFREAFEKGGVLLLDEIDNGNSNILAALNSALSNGFATFCGKTIKASPNVFYVAAANTAGMGPEAGFLGRNGVDLATLDRFYTIHVEIDNKLETGIVKAINEADHAAIIKAVRKLRKVVEARGLRIIVSPRTSITTAKLMTAGIPMAKALKGTALKGVEASLQDSLLAECGL